MSRCLSLLLLWTAAAFEKTSGSSAQLCPAISGQPTCVCKSKKGVIDLTSLGYNNESAPMFANIPASGDGQSIGGSIFSYNPCYMFSKDGCNEAHICDFNGIMDSIIGDEGMEKIYSYDNGSAYVFYNGVNSRGHVTLHCTNSNSSSFSYIRKDDVNDIYFFNLSSCKVCPGGCPELDSAVAVGLVGLVLMIMFLVAVVTYFVVGVLIMRLKYNAQTVMEAIPNSMFWMDVPLLIKDGCVFTFKPVVNLIRNRNRDKYQRIN